MDTTVADPLVGQVLDGRYLVRSRIARGGMATVYAGHDTKLDRAVALKVMHANLATDADFVRRFIGEAKNAAALSHPNVVAVYDQGTDKGYVFLAMEHVPGRTLRDLLTERGRLGPREALQVMQPVLAALGAAHRAGLIHRDVKPENVLLTGDGRVKVADFGLARAETASKQTKTGMIIGTVGYLAPEQVLTGDADARSDVYAAGIMLFELLTGRQPYQGGTPLAVAYKHVNETVPLPSSVIPGLPHRIDALVAGATDREPARRPADADHFHMAAGEVYRSLPPDIDASLASMTPSPAPSDPALPAGPAAMPPLPGTATGATAYLPQHGVPQHGVPQHGVPQHGATQTFDPRTMTMAPRGDGPPPSLKDRLTRPPGVYGAVAAGFVLVLLLGGLIWFQTVGGTQQVPRLTGLSEEDARVQAENVGLKVRVGPSRYDPAVPKDKVAEVQPTPGTPVKKGTILTLVLSRGKRPVHVPDVRNQPLEQAKQALRQAGLQPGVEIQQDSTTVPRGSVIRTRPQAGDTQHPDDPVTIVVSRGITMPNLVGVPPDQAAQALAKLGLTVQWQQQDPAPGQPANTVIAQNPPPGQPIDRGQPVQLTITRGQCAPWDLLCKFRHRDDGNNAQVAVPNVVGQQIAFARHSLRSAGFDVNVRNGDRADVVTGQNPAAGGTAPKNTVVTIWH